MFDAILTVAATAMIAERSLDDAGDTKLYLRMVS